MTVCIFASSSSRINKEYASAASSLDCFLPTAGMDVVFGGGGIGLMGKLPDAVLEETEVDNRSNSIVFMKDEGWDHSAVSKMIVTTRYAERKKGKWFAMANAIVALPGGVRYHL